MGPALDVLRACARTSVWASKCVCACHTQCQNSRGAAGPGREGAWEVSLARYLLEMAVMRPVREAKILLVVCSSVATKWKRTFWWPGEKRCEAASAALLVRASLWCKRW